VTPLQVSQQGGAVRSLKEAGADKQRIEAEVKQLLALKERLAVSGAPGGEGNEEGRGGCASFARGCWQPSCALRTRARLPAGGRAGRRQHQQRQHQHQQRQRRQQRRL